MPETPKVLSIEFLLKYEVNMPSRIHHKTRAATPAYMCRRNRKHRLKKNRQSINLPGKKKETVCQLALLGGKMISIAVPERLVCSSCHHPSIKTMSCPCGENIKCRRCIVSCLQINAGLSLGFDVCRACDKGIQGSIEKRLEGEKLYDKVENITSRGVNRKDFEWCITPYSNAEEISSEAHKTFYQPLISGNVSGACIPISSLALSGQSPEKHLLLNQGELLRRPLHKSEDESSQEYNQDNFADKCCAEGVVMLGSAEKTFRIVKSVDITQGNKCELTMNDVGFSLQFDNKSLAEPKRGKLTVICQVLLPEAIRAAIPESALNGIVSGLYMINSSVETDPVTINIQHCLALSQGCMGHLLDHYQALGLKFVNAVAVDLGKKPFTAEIIAARVNHAHQYASVITRLPDHPVFIFLVSASGNKKYSDDDLYSEQKKQIQALPQLPLAGSQRVAQPYHLRNKPEEPWFSC
ncbi:hypothetical protein M3P05_19050 [Sansalvadorimonas sp. 2012CJ34-2]|uniref:Uncharacterized protein n=1 Tax=Parendozoicomonas callyspongiae TaxID=2942213 RepID=A0ABT0PNJ2_9GAMM|nr:hypothetical protein [Sansalvadorimonas sp. 2012CJ34-2]MCL6272023.1 hypothetical protein [Sansalvadorimonas sp. 2012CJ34-2]